MVYWKLGWKLPTDFLSLLGTYFEPTLKFYLSGPHKSSNFDFWNIVIYLFVCLFLFLVCFLFVCFIFSRFFIFKLFSFSSTWDPISENFTTLLLGQIAFKLFKTSVEFASQRSSQKWCSGFFKVWASSVKDFSVNFKFTIVPNRNIKNFTFPQSRATLGY